MCAYTKRCFSNAVPAALRNLQGICFRFESSVIVFSPSRFVSSSFVCVYTTWWSRCAGSSVGTIYRFDLSVARHTCVKIANAGALALHVKGGCFDTFVQHSRGRRRSVVVGCFFCACTAGMVIRRCAPANDTSKWYRIRYLSYFMDSSEDMDNAMSITKKTAWFETSAHGM